MENEALREEATHSTFLTNQNGPKLKSSTQTYYFQLLENNADTNLSLPVSLEREVQKWVKRREG